MKKFLGLLLSFILIFTMIPQGVLADDPEPTPTPTVTPIPPPTGTLVASVPYGENGRRDTYNEDGTLWDYYYENDVLVRREPVNTEPTPTPTPTPEPTATPTPEPTPTPTYTIEIPVTGYDVVAKFYISGSIHTVVLCVNGQDRAPVSRPQPTGRPFNYQPFLDSAGELSFLGSTSAIKDPERSNETLVPANEHDPNVGLGEGYYYLGSYEERAPGGAMLSTDIYRKMSSPFYGVHHVSGVNPGDLLEVALCAISWADDPSVVGGLVNTLGTYITINKFNDNFYMSGDWNYGTIKYTYDYVFVMNEYRYVTHRKTLYYIHSYPKDGYEEVEWNPYLGITNSTADLPQGDGVFVDYEAGIPAIAYCILGNYIHYGQHICQFDDCLSDIRCNICNTERIPGHDLSWIEVVIKGGPNWLPIGVGHQKVCNKCEYIEQEGLHTYTNCGDATCNICGIERTEFYHTYPNPCTDTECSVCHTPREAPGHDISGYRWVITGEYNICKEYQNYCIKPGCYYYNVLTVDDTHNYLDCGDTSCEDCGYDRGESNLRHTYPSVWRYFSHDEHTRACTVCGHPEYAYHSLSDWAPSSEGCKRTCECGYYETKNHRYADCEDATCEDCGGVRLYPPGHTYLPCTDFSQYQHKRVCSVCEHPDYVNHTYSTSWRYFSHDEHTRECTECGHPDYASHSYSDWGRYTSAECKRTCECGYYQTKNHRYADCLDTTCEDCQEPRIAPGHSFSWTYYTESIDRGECSLCGAVQFTGHSYPSNWVYFSSDMHRHACVNCGNLVYGNHSYSNWTPSTEGCKRTCECGYYQTKAHTYDDCTDTTCNVCGNPKPAENHTFAYTYYSSSMDRGVCTKCGTAQLVPHSYPSDWTYYTYDQHRHVCANCGNYVYGNHSYSDCADSYCNICGGYRTAPGHSYPSWTDSSSAQHSRTCLNCPHVQSENHSYPANWTFYSSTLHSHNCIVCGHQEITSHSYPSGNWSSSSSSQHRHACLGGCGNYEYANHSFSSWQYYSSTQHRRTCSPCGYRAYQNHNWVFIGGGKYRCAACNSYQ